jgi:hypothetical protein
VRYYFLKEQKFGRAEVQKGGRDGARKGGKKTL